MRGARASNFDKGGCIRINNETVTHYIRVLVRMRIAKRQTALSARRIKSSLPLNNATMRVNLLTLLSMIPNRYYADVLISQANTLSGKNYEGETAGHRYRD